jgi:hypothetical protein
MMSFELQGNATCGLDALRYALSLFGMGMWHGRELTLKQMRRFFGKRNTVDEHRITEVAEALGLRVVPHAYPVTNPDGVLADLEEATRKQHVCIVSWHDEDENDFHWVCVAGFAADRVLLFDPFLCDDDLPRRFEVLEEDHAAGLMSRKRFCEWLVPFQPVEKPGDHHFFLELWPRDDLRQRWMPGMVDEQLFDTMRRDDELIANFDEYLDDLSDIFGHPASFEGGEPAWQFLERHQAELKRLFDLWTLPESCPKKFRKLELGSLLALTRCYAFRVQPGAEGRVLLNLGWYLGWRACTRSYEVDRYEE